MNKADWDKVKGALGYTGGKVDLDCDGYNVSLIRLPEGGLKDCVVVCIDGKTIFKKAMEDCEERRRFCREVRHKAPLKAFGLTSKEASKWSKKKREEFDKKRTYITFRPIWNNVDTLRRHFEKNNENVELVKEGYL